ncbi:alpha-N-acetylglucosaminidase [Microlunatus speluncae]|uniref:alpha-N-acetylglucosaminidase n=1 Tax=Microlunatus speluncae TaxID=2594267 RepID=UPI001266134F|nr:alpha-N-acetylglucosaminidase [Microlunatus speluncae]
MRIRVVGVLVGLVIVSLLSLSASRFQPAAFDPAPAVAALNRLLPGHATQFTLVPVARPAAGDFFALSGDSGRIRVDGTSPATLLTGVGWYLKHVARVDLSWPGDSLDRLPQTLPAPGQVIRQAATVPHRFALNDTDDGYSGAYRDWPAYQRQIDLLALHGVNEVFVSVGTDAVYHAAFQEFGYSAAELRDWIPGPAHQPWWLLQNLSGFGGPLSEQQLAARAALGRQLVTRLTELGMTAVLPGYFGTVPPDFPTRNPSGRVIPQGTWGGFSRPDWLDPRTPVFDRVAEAFYRQQERLLGRSTMIKMDLLHEGGDAGDVPVADAARAVFAALDAARPGATWVLLGWKRNPLPEILTAVDRSRLFIVDGLSDRLDDLDRERSWLGTPYAFGTIPNFGGHTTIGANTAVWATRFDQWRSKPGSALRGIAYLPEGTGTDPTAFELFTELAWRAGPVDQQQWFADYAARRYGGSDPHAIAAWAELRRGPYSMRSGTWSEPQDSLFTARPSLTATSAAGPSPKSVRYDPGTVERALTELLAVDPALRGTDAYRYDLITTARQALANRSRTLLPMIKSAYDRQDQPGFRRLAAEWKSDLDLLDRLLASDERFLLGPWLQGAKAAGLEHDVRSLITVWGPRAASESDLHDYANRELAGLVSDFYAVRWTRYLDGLETALATGTPAEPIDWFRFEDGWARETKDYPLTPTGDPYTLATEVARVLAR